MIRVKMLLRALVQALQRVDRDEDVCQSTAALDALSRDIRRDAIEAFDMGRDLIQRYPKLYAESSSFVDFLFRLCKISPALHLSSRPRESDSPPSSTPPEEVRRLKKALEECQSQLRHEHVHQETTSTEELRRLEKALADCRSQLKLCHEDQKTASPKELQRLEKALEASQTASSEEMLRLKEARADCQSQLKACQALLYQEKEDHQSARSDLASLQTTHAVLQAEFKTRSVRLRETEQEVCTVTETLRKEEENSERYRRKWEESTKRALEWQKKWETCEELSRTDNLRLERLVFDLQNALKIEKDLNAEHLKRIHALEAQQLSTPPASSSLVLPPQSASLQVSPTAPSSADVALRLHQETQHLIQEFKHYMQSQFKWAETNNQRLHGLFEGWMRGFNRMEVEASPPPAAITPGEERLMLPAGEERSMLPAGEQRLMLPAGEERLMLPAGEQHLMLATPSQAVAIPSDQQVVLATDDSRPADAPSQFLDFIETIMNRVLTEQLTRRGWDHLQIETRLQEILDRLRPENHVLLPQLQELKAHVESVSATFVQQVHAANTVQGCTLVDLEARNQALERQILNLRAQLDREDHTHSEKLKTRIRELTDELSQCRRTVDELKAQPPPPEMLELTAEVNRLRDRIAHLQSKKKKPLQQSAKHTNVYRVKAVQRATRNVRYHDNVQQWKLKLTRRLQLDLDPTASDWIDALARRIETERTQPCQRWFDTIREQINVLLVLFNVILPDEVSLDPLTFGEVIREHVEWQRLFQPDQNTHMAHVINEQIWSLHSESEEEAMVDGSEEEKEKEKEEEKEEDTPERPSHKVFTHRVKQEHFRDSLTLKEAEITTLQHRVTELQEEQTQLRLNLEGCNNSIAKLQRDHAKEKAFLTQKNEQLIQERDVEVTKIEGLQADLTQQRSTTERTQQELALARKACEEELQQVRVELDDLKQQHEQLQREALDYTQQIEVAKKLRQQDKRKSEEDLDHIRELHNDEVDKLKTQLQDKDRSLEYLREKCRPQSVKRSASEENLEAAAYPISQRKKLNPSSDSTMEVEVVEVQRRQRLTPHLETFADRSQMYIKLLQKMLYQIFKKYFFQRFELLVGVHKDELMEVQDIQRRLNVLKEDMGLTKLKGDKKVFFDTLIKYVEMDLETMIATEWTDKDFGHESNTMLETVLLSLNDELSRHVAKFKR